MYTALLQSLLDYVNVAWGEISQKDIGRSFSTYKTVRLELFLEGKPQDTRRVLNWLSLACRRKRYKCIKVFKC